MTFDHSADLRVLIFTLGQLREILLDYWMRPPPLSNHGARIQLIRVLADEHRRQQRSRADARDEQA
jgi:hypothetical protein